MEGCIDDEDENKDDQESEGSREQDNEEDEEDKSSRQVGSDTRHEEETLHKGPSNLRSRSSYTSTGSISRTHLSVKACLEYSESPLSALTLDSSMAKTTAAKKAGTFSLPKQAAVATASRHSPRIAPTACSHSKTLVVKQKKKKVRRKVDEEAENLDLSKRIGQAKDDDDGRATSVPKKMAESKRKTTKRKKGDESDDSEDSDDNEDDETDSNFVEILEGEDEENESSAHVPKKNRIEEVEEKSGEADDVVDDDLLAAYQAEKDLINNCIKTRDKRLKSDIWSKVIFLDNTSVLQCCSATTAKDSNFEGIIKIQQHIRDCTKSSLPVLCSICYGSSNIPLKSGIVFLYLKKRGKGKDPHDAPQTSNFLNHLRTHRDEPHSTFHESLNSKFCSEASVETRKSGASLGSLAKTSFSEWAALPKAQVLTKMHQLLYVVINDANIPAHIVRNPKLWDLIEFIAANGKSLDGTSRSTLVMGRHKFNTIQAISFADMVYVIERLVDENRKYFKTLTDHRVPFLYVGHDLWDGKNKNVLGLCIFMVSHLLKKMIAFPVGILRSHDKKAETVAADSLRALKR